MKPLRIVDNAACPHGQSEDRCPECAETSKQTAQLAFQAMQWHLTGGERDLVRRMFSSEFERMWQAIAPYGGQELDARKFATLLLEIARAVEKETL